MGIMVRLWRITFRELSFNIFPRNRLNEKIVYL
jgi:hypothetical protein